ncbi:hypothetical protein [Paludisphaera soli]|uniref:hypothetical protein n=1 Tax=Paludisphaera soli TaxID=2712865 RepID=UPI0013EA52FF|nr:hypothetical protein [Paludisphaera soli]
MDPTQRIDCPLCGNRGKVKEAPPAGAKIRCPKCGGTFAHGATAAPPAEPAERGAEDPLVTMIVARESEPESVFKPADAPRGEPLGEWIEAKALDALAKRIAGLESRNRLLAWACGLIGLVAVAGLATPFQERFVMPRQIQADLLVAKRVQVVDESGQVMANLGVIDQGLPLGALTIGAGPNSSTASLTGAGLMLFKGDGQLSAMISPRNPLDGRPFISLDDGDNGSVEITARPSLTFRRGEAGDQTQIKLNVGLGQIRPFIDFFDPERGGYDHLITP